ncbi:DUF4397 domain-containing protein [Sphingobacterium sp. Mn56C]|uniref:DUF4397 domain-containing protein n=1 Tax=Sphingobacterium sp. Mn56C TaxID=3395261 RepID=UPI003BDA0347
MRACFSFIGVFILLLITGCNKDGLSLNRPNDTPGNIAAVATFNLIPGSTSVVGRLGAASLYTLTGSFDFGRYAAYKNFLPGTNKLEVESFFDNKERKQLVQNISLTAGRAYSLFLYEDKEVGSLLTEDNIILPREGYAKVRFVHMGKSLSPLSLYIGNEDKPLFANIAFKGVSDFKEISTHNTGPLEFKAASGSNTVLLTIEPQNLISREIYSVLVIGDLESNLPNEKLQAKIVIHSR